MLSFRFVDLSRAKNKKLTEYMLIDYTIIFALASISVLLYNYFINSFKKKTSQ